MVNARLCPAHTRIGEYSRSSSDISTNWATSRWICTELTAQRFQIICSSIKVSPKSFSLVKELYRFRCGTNESPRFTGNDPTFSVGVVCFGRHPFAFWIYEKLRRLVQTWSVLFVTLIDTNEESVRCLCRPPRDHSLQSTMRRVNQPANPLFCQLFSVLLSVRTSLTLFMIKCDVTNDRLMLLVTKLVGQNEYLLWTKNERRMFL
jgi:hypothetical protein